MRVVLLISKSADVPAVQFLIGLDFLIKRIPCLSFRWFFKDASEPYSLPQLEKLH